MILKRILAGSMTLALLVGALPYQWAHAQSPAIQAARESVGKNVAQPAESLEVRRATMVSILDLTTTELEDTLGTKKLGTAVSQEDVGLAAIAEQLTDYLVMYRAYVSLLRAQVARADISGEDLKAIAIELKEWREKVYDPAMHQAFDLLLVVQGEEVLSTTRQRLDRVNVDVKKIQTSVGVDANVLVPMLEAARKNVGAAAGYHDLARAILIEEQSKFIVDKNTVSPGVPRLAVLRRGDTGDFVCAPAQDQRAECRLIFKLRSGAAYAIKTKTGLPLVVSPGDISSLEGSLLTLKPLFSGDTITGLFFVATMNPAVSVIPDARLFSGMEASVIESIDTKKSVPTETVQSLIKKEVAEIGQAYKIFFSMSTIAKKLLNR